MTRSGSADVHASRWSTPRSRRPSRRRGSRAGRTVGKVRRPAGCRSRTPQPAGAGVHHQDRATRRSRVLRDVGGTTERTGRQARDTGASSSREMARSLGRGHRRACHYVRPGPADPGSPSAPSASSKAQMIAVAKDHRSDGGRDRAVHRPSSEGDGAGDPAGPCHPGRDRRRVAGQLGIRGIDNILSLTQGDRRAGVGLETWPAKEAATALHPDGST